MSSKVAILLDDTPIGTEYRGGSETYNTKLYNMFKSKGIQVDLFMRGSTIEEPSMYDLIVCSDWAPWNWSPALLCSKNCVVLLHDDFWTLRYYVESHPEFTYVVQHLGGIYDYINGNRYLIYPTSRIEGLEPSRPRIVLPDRYSLVVSSPLSEKGAIQSVDKILVDGGVPIYAGCDDLNNQLVKKILSKGAINYGRASPSELALLFDRAEKLVHLPISWREGSPLVVVESYSRGTYVEGNHRCPAYNSELVGSSKDSVLDWYMGSVYSNSNWVRSWSRLLEDYM
jgi:glycosyltransferase involved in cell wall biosynthesis